eukprot:TRINITY_DN292_c0_g1_i1.p1 TRINITY_DN292_c0_g1~~TRINITY_DN292_c0_g1_i1.p1  ORF type:complete len:327 (-),score=89.56 TRINITY_DN292_c0_g1_i1:751-1692(-)
MSWSRPSVTGVTPSSRCAHTFTGVGTRHERAYVFGGWSGKQMLADIHVLNTDTMTWSEAVPADTTEAPLPRGGHTVCEFERRLYVFGGGSGAHFVNDLHVLDLAASCWRQLRVAGTIPSPRSRHAAAFVGSLMYVLFGGDDTRVYDDVHVFDVLNNTWRRVDTIGDRPCARWGHSVCVLGNDKLVVFGGHDGERMLNDVHVLTLSTMAWTRVPVAGGLGAPRPAARAGHTATRVGTTIVVFWRRRRRPVAQRLLAALARSDNRRRRPRRRHSDERRRQADPRHVARRSGAVAQRVWNARATRHSLCALESCRG